MPALRRGVRILDFVAAASAPPAAADIARALSLPRSTAHGLIAAMVDMHLLVRAADGTYRMGPHLMSWANGFLAQADLVGAFRSAVAGQPDLARLTLTLTIREGAEVIYLACNNSSEPLGFTFRIGMRLPAPFAATGKAMLAALPLEVVTRLVADGLPPPMTPRSVQTLPELLHELEETRARGWSLDDGQIREGMVCVGASVSDHNGTAIAGIATSLLENEATPETLAYLGNEMRRIAGLLSHRLGAA
ncbi:IclR family transcriptional regulator [Pseudoxanthobacter sp.]|uniref:IclR family transcriptional regulator n=1 Tax=Pseudoxanthobacter sp. TaxID=1925742 RepID=UPI002FE18839